jgi:hypothetical protein
MASAAETLLQIEPKNNVDMFSRGQLKTVFHSWNWREINNTGKEKLR